MQYLRMLVRYKAWANDAFLSAVQALPQAHRAAPQPIVFGSLLRTLHHAQAMDVVWRAHLLGEAHGYTTRNPTECPEFDVLAVKQAEIDRWYVDYADALSDDVADEVVAFEFIGGGRGALSRRDILLHVVNHTTYHRGHAADMLYGFGVAPPTTDLPVFLRTLAGQG